MAFFSPKDVTVEHYKLMDRRGQVRLLHRPTGLSVDAYLNGEPISKVTARLMKDLENRVAQQPEQALRPLDQ